MRGSSGGAVLVHLPTSARQGRGAVAWRRARPLGLRGPRSVQLPHALVLLQPRWPERCRGFRAHYQSDADRGDPDSGAELHLAFRPCGVAPRDGELHRAAGQLRGCHDRSRRRGAPAGRSIPARIAIIAITTNNSINVKPFILLEFFIDSLSLNSKSARILLL